VPRRRGTPTAEEIVDAFKVSERDVLWRTFSQEADLPLSVRLDVLTAVKVRDIMTWEVETIDADDDLSTAAQIMLDANYGCLPVVEEGVLAGILTEADFVKFVTEVGAPSRALRSATRSAMPDRTAGSGVRR
jgi:CBS domain-containing protein